MEQPYPHAANPMQAPNAAGHAGDQIVYCKGRTGDAVPDSPDDLAPIDLQDALMEAMALSCADLKSDAYTWIVFYNRERLDSVNILRTREDQWNLSVPAFCRDVRFRFKYIAFSDTEGLGELIRAFFAGYYWHWTANFSFDADTFEAERSLFG